MPAKNTQFLRHSRHGAIAKNIRLRIPQHTQVFSFIHFGAVFASFGCVQPKGH